MRTFLRSFTGRSGSNGGVPKDDWHRFRTQVNPSSHFCVASQIDRQFVESDSQPPRHKGPRVRFPARKKEGALRRDSSARFATEENTAIRMPLVPAGIVGLSTAIRMREERLRSWLTRDPENHLSSFSSRTPWDQHFLTKDAK
jgi:hypothetical protein